MAKVPEGFEQIEPGVWARGDIRVVKIHTQRWEIRHADGRCADTPLLKRRTEAFAWLADHPRPPWLAHGVEPEVTMGPPAAVEGGKTTAFHLGADHRAALKAEALRLGVSSSEVLRQILDRHFSVPRKLS